MTVLRHSLARTISRIGLASSSILASAAILATAAQAQAQGTATAAADENDDDVIVVTAQMREQNLQDVPLAITAVSGAQLEARSQTRLTDITAQSPNVILQQNPAGSGNSMRAFIRGVGQSDQSPSVEPGVGIYIDDIYFGTVTASAFDLTDLDRVEVLRGPQGTLAGMNSQGGAIRLYSKKPQGEGGSVEVALGNFKRRDIKASADFTVVPDALYARITGVTRNRDGYVTRYDYACLNPSDPDVVSGAIPRLAAVGNDCKLGELGNQSMYALRGSLRLAPAGSPLEINVSADYTRDESATQASVLIASAESASKGTASPSNRSGMSIPYQGVAFDDRFVPYGKYRRASSPLNDGYASYANFYDPGVMYSAAGPQPAGAPPSAIPAGAPLGPFIAPSASQVDGWGVSGTIDYEISPFFSLKSITGYRKYFSQSGSDNDNSPIVFIQDNSKFHHRQFSQELRLSGNLVNDTVHVTLGGYYYDAATRYEARIHTPFSGFCAAATPCFSFINDDTADLTTYAGFGNVAWDVTDRLTLEGGIRVTHQRKDYTFGRFNPDGLGEYLPLSNPENPLSGQVGTYKETLTDLRLAASYKVTPDVMLYAQYATGFKGGGISPRPYSFYQIRPFGAEKLKSYEVGFKGDFLDRRVRLNVTGFYMDYEGYQGVPQVCIGLDGQELPPDRGGVSGLCGQYLNIGNAEVKGFELETTIRPVRGWSIDGSWSLTDFTFTSINYPTTSIVVGASRPGIGKWKWSIGTQYEADLGFGTLTPRVDVNYTPGYCGDFLCSPNAQVAKFTVVNARIAFQTIEKDWTVAVEATNLFDKYYFLNKFQNAFYTTGQPGRPREVALTVRRNF
ncbi:TonB-dependent receptor-like protein [Sphingobium sp. SYK-6]|uniref:TonB-dependent receptor n=1 Tax=Sphingobium sp. (strain NBRC 103272 / SYK-6) TaxID=627192 RepID=UPI0002276D75|nr:TonB-dependent receptor [Sphingobium sp. SYK-6]BAK65601.1 TonB-dependent receptor-like protein [Sphingobium sp. SYK-6]